MISPHSICGHVHVALQVVDGSSGGEVTDPDGSSASDQKNDSDDQSSAAGNERRQVRFEASFDKGGDGSLEKNDKGRYQDHGTGD